MPGLCSTYHAASLRNFSPTTPRPAEACRDYGKRTVAMKGEK